MPHGIPESFWDDYQRRIEAELVQIREMLAPLESGKMRLSSSLAGGAWRDETNDWIAIHKRTIETYEVILAALRKKELP